MNQRISPSVTLYSESTGQLGRLGPLSRFGVRGAERGLRLTEMLCEMDLNCEENGRDVHTRRLYDTLGGM